MLGTELFDLVFVNQSMVLPLASALAQPDATRVAVNQLAAASALALSTDRFRIFNGLPVKNFGHLWHLLALMSLWEHEELDHVGGLHGLLAAYRIMPLVDGLIVLRLQAL